MDAALNIPEVESSGPVHSQKTIRPPSLAYQILDWASGALIIALACLAPWLFGGVEDWAIWWMNATGYALGVLLLAKWFYRLLAPFPPPRFINEKKTGAWIVIGAAFLTLLALGYCLVSALNARATFNLRERSFDYHDFNPRWPFTYDDLRSWRVFWIYLALACFFWSLRDWLLGKSKRERHQLRSSPNENERAFPSSSAIPDRLKLLLWFISINGGLIAFEGILQRLSGTTSLLWLRESYWHDADSCFGPYSYRSNAAQYLNLIWPVSLGFWWTLTQSRRRHRGRTSRMGEGPQLILLPLTILMAAAPVISLSRGGAVISVFNLLLCGLVILLNRRTLRSTRVVLVCIGLAALAAGWWLNGPKLQKRFENLEKDNWSQRGEIYDNSKKIAEDFRWFGSGPGTFRSIYALYRGEASQIWAAFVHDDWLETRITFGVLGMSILLTLLLLALSRWFVPGPIPIPPVLGATIAISIVGCLLHAKFDFPLQVYSILLLFLLNCGILFTTSRPASPA
jgi:hypothetical protein